MGSYHVRGLVVEILEADITQVDADAIVNAANDHLWMGSGVAGAIKRRGGEIIEREAVAKGPIEVGTAVETTAGELPYRYIIHGAVMGQNLRTNHTLIRVTTTNCLELADRLGLKSLALPAFGTGVGGLGAGECALMMLGAIEDFGQVTRKLQRIVLALFGEQTRAEFEQVAREVWGEGQG